VADLQRKASLAPTTFHEATCMGNDANRCAKPIEPREERRLVTLRRLTLRCSGRGNHKVLGRGRPASCAYGRWRARVLMRWRAAAELGS
jgi:hypothetical protein